MILRLGLCCRLLDAPIHFRTATHRYVSTLLRAARRTYLATIAADNAVALAAAVERCAELGIGAFRINSQLLPLGTHPVSGYALEALDRNGAIRAAFERARDLARARGIRLSFHPDQFVVLNSEREDVVRASAEELEFQAAMAEMKAQAYLHTYYAQRAEQRGNHARRSSGDAAIRYAEAFQRVTPQVVRGL